ncbi:putative transporter [Azospirillum rugosum]|uniref:Transport protein n=1 Tax=Azospirillum rugosum TaxID=416170 RepID=A0ABS4SVM6_9PROT|nr:putative transporter [Azospirillum rugosum]MBP2296626.1 putative transport protein [Azospirillum rugosum]MDQ0530315.1 putative transport protein [Azospirillum rugosum]
MHALAELFAAIFQGMPPIARVVFMLGVTSAAGLALGHIKLRGVGLGIGGVLFAGIAGGHLAKQAGVTFDAEMLDFIRDFGLILFVYTIGIQVGPGFFAALKKSGLALNGLALLMVGSSILITALLVTTGLLPLGSGLGVFAGGVTNAPALAASQQVLKEVGAESAAMALPGLAFAVTYPFGIAGNLLAMAAVRAVFGIDPQAEARGFEAARRAEVAALETMDIAVRNLSVHGVRLAELTVLDSLGVCVSRLLRDGQLRVPTGDTRLACGDVLHVVGPRLKLEQARMLLGVPADVRLTTQGSDLRWERIVVTANAVLGKSIAALNLKGVCDVVVSRVTRAGIELVPDAALKLQFGDILTVIGKPDDLRAVARIIGNSERRLQTAEMIPVFVGIALGAALGSIPLFLPGMPAPLRLGMAGGPLIAAILLARLGHVGPLVWFMPPAANLALRELGIVLFLAVLGIASGDRFVETMASGAGLPWMAWGVLVTLVPLLLTGLVARGVMGLNFLTICGVLAGAQTNPPGLAYANALVTSEAPALAYATVYPLAMCLRILAPQLLVLMLW